MRGASPRLVISHSHGDWAERILDNTQSSGVSRVQVRMLHKVVIPWGFTLLRLGTCTDTYEAQLASLAQK